jgi:hypothetical protein
MTTDTIDAPADLYALAQEEQSALDRCEAVIARGVQTFIEVGEALTEIRDKLLYRFSHKTFDHYCKEKWGIGRARAYQLMDAAPIARELSTRVDNPPANEKEARAVAKSAPADRPRVIERATEIAGGEPRTAKHIQQAVAEIAAPFWQSIDAHHPTAHLWRRERPDLLKSACGMFIQNRLPSGSTEAGHCSSCVRATWPQAKEQPKIPEVAPELPPEFAIVQRRFAAHGWKLIRHGVWYKLSQPDGTLHNTYPTIEAHAATLEVLDRAAARQGAAPTFDQQSDRQDHIAKEQRDRDRISTARANIGVGNIGDARRILSTIEVSTWERDQLLCQIARGAALAFLGDQRARLKHFSAAAMISQTTFTQALDHIEALLNYVVTE